MKNIVKVCRMDDKKSRLYALPEDVKVERGTLVSVQSPNGHDTCFGITESSSYVTGKPDDQFNVEQLLMDLYNMDQYKWDNMKRVICIYDKRKLEWDDSAEEIEDEEKEEE